MAGRGAFATRAAVVLCVAALFISGSRPAYRELRVCADPNNLPFSNARGEGFENRVAAVIADELGAKVRYTWWAQRRGFFRHTLNAGLCDVVLGVPACSVSTACRCRSQRPTRPPRAT